MDIYILPVTVIPVTSTICFHNTLILLQTVPLITLHYNYLNSSLLLVIL